MAGIVLTLLAVLFVFCLAFRYSDQGPSARTAKGLHFLDKGHKKKS